MRGTRHNARGVKNSSVGFSDKHNDRNYNLEQADNIDQKKIKDNRYWNIYSKKWYSEQTKKNHFTFAEVEQKYYEEHFKKQYDKIMDGYEKKRNYKRLKSFDDWRKDKRYCPEETFVQIGNVDSHATSEQLRDIAVRYINAEVEFSQQHGNCFVILDAALHMDEAVPQLHMRKVWRYVDPETGYNMIGQNKALEQAAELDPKLVLPDPNRKIDAYNNYKMTYDVIMREKFLDICEQCGVAVEREPERDAKHNRSKKKLIADKKRQKKAVEQQITDLQTEKNTLEQEIAKKQEMLQNYTEQQILEAATRIQKKRMLELKRQEQRTEQAAQELNLPRRGKRSGKIQNVQEFDI